MVCPLNNNWRGSTRLNIVKIREAIVALGRPGSDLLSRVLRQSTISAGAFHGRVRNGIGCSRSAITTRSAKRNNFSRSWYLSVDIVLLLLLSSLGFKARPRVDHFWPRPRKAAPQECSKVIFAQQRWTFVMGTIKSIERLVSVSSMCHHTSTPDLSTWSSSTVLREYSFPGGFPA